jgi:hypothetical protein
LAKKKDARDTKEAPGWGRKRFGDPSAIKRKFLRYGVYFSDTMCR